MPRADSRAARPEGPTTGGYARLISVLMSATATTNAARSVVPTMVRAVGKHSTADFDVPGLIRPLDVMQSGCLQINVWRLSFYAEVPTNSTPVS